MPSETIKIVVDGETHEVQDPDRAGAIATGALLANADRVELGRNGAAGDDVTERLDEVFGRVTAPEPASEPEASADHDDVEAAVADVEAEQEDSVDEDPVEEESDDQEAGDDVEDELPEFEDLVEEDNGDHEHDDETPEPPQAQSESEPKVEETEDCGDVESEPSADLGTYEAKSYGLVFTRDVQDFFTDDAERVTVRERDGRYELAPGPSEDWPDYAVSAAGIQVGNPGQDVLGVEAGEEVVATADGDVVVLEVVGEDPDQEDGPDDDDDEDLDDGRDDPQEDTDGDGEEEVPDRWCGYCGDGPFEGDAGVDEHHDDEDHPGDPVVRESDPADADWVAMADQEDSEGEEVDVSTVCEDCGEAFESAVGKKRHRQMEHGAEREGFPKECGSCGTVCDDSLEYAVHKTESHGQTRSELEFMEPGEFESIVEGADQVADIFEAVPWSSERTLRMLGVYGLEDLIGGNVEVSDLTDFEFDGIDDVDQKEPNDDHQEPAAEPDPAPETVDQPDPDDPDYDGAAYKPAALQGGGS